MKHQLFIDSDTCLEFSSRSKAFQHVDRHEIPKWMLLTIHASGKCDVFNPFESDKYGSEGIVDLFETERDAHLYIGSYL